MKLAEKSELYQRSANLGQAYGVAAALRTLAEEAVKISGLCLESKHAETLGRIAKQADSICCHIMAEWDKVKQSLE